jgi:hypothetical protein
MRVTWHAPRPGRWQIATVARVRELGRRGLTLVAARQVLALEDRISQLEARIDARAESAQLRTELAAARAGPD